MKENKYCKIALNEGTTHIETDAPLFITGELERAADLAVVRIGFLKELVKNMDKQSFEDFKYSLTRSIEDSDNFDELVREVEDALGYQKMIDQISEYTLEEGGLAQSDSPPHVVGKIDLPDEGYKGHE